MPPKDVISRERQAVKLSAWPSTRLTRGFRDAVPAIAHTQQSALRRHVAQRAYRCVVNERHVRGATPRMASSSHEGTLVRHHAHEEQRVYVSPSSARA